MRQEEQLIEKCGRELPYRVPEGYFESFRTRIEASLPEYPAPPQAEPMSLWNKVKPYLYLAAMFAGIWCMMKMFHIMSTSPQVMVDNPPEAVITALNDRDTYEFFIEPTDATDFELEEEVSSQYTDIEEFAEDFGYEIRPEYDDMEFEEPAGT